MYLSTKSTLLTLITLVLFSYSPVAQIVNLDAVTVDVSRNILSSTSIAMQYSTNSTNGTDGNWEDCTSPLTAIDFGTGGFPVYVREKANTGSFELVATIAAQANAPDFTIDYFNEQTNEAVSHATEYSYNSSFTNAVTTESGKIPLQPGKTYYIRIKATKTALASKTQTLQVDIRRTHPAFTIDYYYEKTNESVTSDIVYSESSNIANAQNGTGAKLDIAPGTDLFFAYQATSTMFRSEIFHLTVPQRPAVPQYTIDFANEQTNENVPASVNISSAPEMTNTENGQNAPVAITPGTTLYLQQTASSSAKRFQSEVTVFDIPDRPAAPYFDIDFINEQTTQAIPTTVIYASSSAMGNAISGEKQPIVLTPGTDLYFQTLGGDDYFASEIFHLDVPQRPNSPSISIDYQNETTLQVIGNTMEYDFTAAMSSVKNGNGNVVELMPEKDMYFRYIATSSSFASEIEMLNVPQRPVVPAGVFEIDFYFERTKNAIADIYQYSENADMSNTKNGSGAKIDITPGVDIYYRQKALSNSFCSEIYSLNVPDNPNGPVYTVDYMNETTVENVPSSVQYADNEFFNNSMNGNGAPIALTPGNTYYFQQLATSSNFASKVSELHVDSRPAAPVFNVDYQNETTAKTVDANTEYSTNSHMYNAQQGANQTVALNPGVNMYFRTMASASTFASGIFELGVRPRGDAPEYTINYTNETTNEKVYANVWIATKPDFDNQWQGENTYEALTPGQTYYFRKMATVVSFVSETQKLIAPQPPDAPSVALNNMTSENAYFVFAGQNNRRAETTDMLEYSTNNGLNWLPVTDETTVNSFGNTHIIVRKKATENAFISESTENLDTNPTEIDMTLSVSAVDENNDINTAIGTFTINNVQNGVEYILTVDAVSNSNSNLFYIDGKALKTSEPLDFETQKQYEIDIKVAYNDKSEVITFKIDVNDINEAPTAITLSENEIDENVAINTKLADIFVEDEDIADLHTFEIISGNDYFSIDNTSVIVSSPINYESTPEITISIKVTDSDNATYSRSFDITVRNKNDVPAGITLSASDVDENNAQETTIGTFAVTDEDSNDTHTFELSDENGALETDNQYFIIDGNTLKTNAVFDYETNSEYRIFVTVSDAATATYSKWFTITINDLTETHIAQKTEMIFALYPNPATDVVQLVLEPAENIQSIELIDMCGRIVYRRNTILQKNTIPTGNLLPGLYFVRINRGQNSVTKKLLVR